MIFETRVHMDNNATSNPFDPYASERELKRRMHERAQARHATPDAYAEGPEDGDLITRVDASTTNENALKASMAARMSARSRK